VKEDQFRRTRDALEWHNGYMLASTYLQCGPAEGVGGPFQNAGGPADSEAVDADVARLQPGAGILWCLRHVKERYGPRSPPPAGPAAAGAP